MDQENFIQSFTELYKIIELKTLSNVNTIYM